MKFNKSFSVLIALILLFSVNISAQRLNPKLKSKDHKIRRLVVLPAKVELMRSGMKGAEPMEKEAAEITPVLEEVVAKVFEKKNFIVARDTFNEQALQSDEKMRYALADLQRNFDEMALKMYRKQKDIEKGRFTLGDQVLLLNQDDQTDAYVFIRARGMQTTKGKVAFAVVMLNPLIAIPACVVWVTIVDARTGEVLAHTQTVT
ncbi:MAG TPA: hypothetical protein VEF04_19590, partial [Blastocatellia bacterium]|nr:hypothetical protein [Blastocatellia bacterium]